MQRKFYFSYSMLVQILFQSNRTAKVTSASHWQWGEVQMHKVYIQELLCARFAQLILPAIDSVAATRLSISISALQV